MVPNRMVSGRFRGHSQKSSLSHQVQPLIGRFVLQALVRRGLATNLFCATKGTALMRKPVFRIVFWLFSLWLFPRPAALVRADEKTPAGNDSQFAQRIFAAEQMTIAQVSKRTPMLEAYIQSLDPEVRPEAVLDDAYFLGKLGLNVDRPSVERFQALAFGASPESRRIRVNTGDRWALYPEGYVDMLFVDLGEFDEDHYALTYSGRDRLANTNCLRVAVLPLNAQSSGRFTGDIWVDENSFRIVRIMGGFSPRRLGMLSKYFNAGGISRLGLYFHFESWRQEVRPGEWLPSYTYFDEQRMWNTGRLTTSFHLRGHIWLWNYQAPEQMPASTSVQNPFDQLKSSGLLASGGSIESELSKIAERIERVSGTEGAGITCRVLLTTPVEIFSIDKTIFISRGLLNLVPDESTLTGLLAFQIAHITLGHSRADNSAAPPIFDIGRQTDFPGFGIRRTVTEEKFARELMQSRLAGSVYSASVARAESFLRGIARLLPNAPHLTSGLCFSQYHGVSLPAGESQVALQLRGDYGISSWENLIVALNQTPHGESSTAIMNEQSSNPSAGTPDQH